MGVKVSVLLPVYNAGRFLTPALRSILAQDHGGFEVIAIDDGSTDDSLATLRRFAAEDSRMRVVTRPNRGLVHTLNEAIAEAGGEYLARMDADDVALPGRLARQAAHLGANRRIVALGTAFEWIDARGRLIERWRPPTDHAAIERMLLTGDNPICHPSVMMRAAAVKAAGGYRCEAWEDLDLWLRLAEVGELAILPQILQQYRIHDAAISRVKHSEQVQGVRELCLAAQRRRGVSLPLVELGPWRPDATRRSRAQFTTIYGWRAYRNGEFRTALAYGVRALLLRPGHGQAWRLAGWAMVEVLRAGLRRRPGGVKPA